VALHFVQALFSGEGDETVSPRRARCDATSGRGTGADEFGGGLNFHEYRSVADAQLRQFHGGRAGSD
jgi:hypothetical protein